VILDIYSRYVVGWIYVAQLIWPRFAQIN
jgi:hypothetical protein